MSKLRRLHCSHLKITVTAAYILSCSTALASTTTTSSASVASIKTSAPRDFQLLETERQLIVDVYYGGRKLTEATVTVRGGDVRFDQPAQFVGLIPGLLSPKQVQGHLAGYLPGNAALVCGAFSATGDCGALTPEKVGVIFDEDHFRADLFISSSLLTAAERSDPVYLASPEDSVTLVSRYGATLSGNSQGDQFLHVQNRTIISNGAFRLRGDSSLDTQNGATLDTLAFEHDRNDWRYTAGLFWAPGGELLGRRKIIGGGLSTQLDTRVDRRSILGSPLALYLQQSARVDILVDDRLVASRIYAAGNVLVDTSNLPDGSYPIVLRIQESGRPVREESQFFTKGAEVAPVGRPLYSAFAGVISNEHGRVGKGLPFYEFSAAYRLNPDVGIDAKLFGTSSKALLEAGAIAFTSMAKLHASILVSSEGDYGGVLRAASTGRGPISFSLDLRKVVSHDGGPLLPTTRRRSTFNEDLESQIGDQGSYSQGTGIIAARVSKALVRLTGLYRRSASNDPDYSIGGSVELPVLQTPRWNLVLQTDARKTDRDFATLFGMRAFFNRRATSIAASGGYNRLSNRKDRVTGEVQGAIQHEFAPGGDFIADAALGRDFDATYARAGVRLNGNLANFRGEVLQRFGEEGATQYAASLDGGIALGGGRVAFAGRNVSDAAVAVSATGASTTQRFEVLVNDGARAVVGADKAALIFLQPYEAYKVRLRPIGEGLSNFDASDRDVVMHPGRVVSLNWAIAPTFVMFGRAVDSSGSPIANADVSGNHGIGRTDEQGFFQVEARQGDVLRLMTPSKSECRIAAIAGQPVHSFLAAGDMTCQ
jgi:hypothetical protein